MTLTDIISKIILYAKRAIVNDNSSNNAVSISQSGTGAGLYINQSGSGDAARFQGGSSLNGSLKIFDQSSIGGDFVYDGGSDGIFTFKNNGISTSFLNGNVGIDTLTPGQKLDVNGGIRTNNVVYLNNNSGTNRFVSYQSNQVERWHIGVDDTSESGGNSGSNFFIHRFDDSGTFLSRVINIDRASGNVGFGTFPTHPLQMASGAHVTVGGTWTNASDKKLKENISYEYPYGLEQILGLKPAKFDFIKGEKNTIGFIAQDVKEQLPEAISSTKNADNEEIMGINSTAIIATLVKAVQQLSSKVDELTQKVQILETNNSPEPTQP